MPVRTAVRPAVADPAGGEPPVGDDLTAVPLADLEDRVCTWTGRLAAATAEFLRLLAEFDAREGWAGPGIRSCAHWLSWRCGMSLFTARDHVRVARRLRPLPVTAAAFAAGTLSYSKVRAICRVATPGTETELVELARSSTASQTERATRSLPTLVPDAVPVDDSDRPPPDPYRLHWRTDTETGRVSMSLTLPPEDAALVLAVLRDAADAAAAVDRADRAEGAEDGGSDEQPPVRRADSGRWGSFSSRVVVDAFRAAVVGLEEGAAEVAERGASTARPTAEVVVHVDADTLQGMRADADRAGARSHVEGGAAVGLEVIHRLACEGGVRLQAHGSDGRTLDLDRRCRRPSKRQLRVLVQRDGGCAVPGCGRTRFLHAHHVLFWWRGGRTALDNLVLLCGEHHRALHHGAFAVEALGRQRFRFRDDGGDVIEYAPTVRGRAADVAGGLAYAAVDAESLTPDWHGDPLTEEALGLIAARYAAGRAVEREAADPWALAA